MLLPLNFALAEYWIWYPLVCAVFFFHFTVKPPDDAASFWMEVPAGRIVNRTAVTAISGVGSAAADARSAETNGACAAAGGVE